MATVTNSAFVNAFKGNPICYVYDIDYFRNGNKEKWSRVKYPHHKTDLACGQRYKYYNVDSKYVKVDNEFVSSLETTKVGTEVSLIFEKKADGRDFKIKLSGSNPVNLKYLHVACADAELARVTLVCIDYKVECGPTWHVENYAGNIEIR